jgi:transcription termination factor NusB
MFKDEPKERTVTNLKTIVLKRPAPAILEELQNRKFDTEKNINGNISNNKNSNREDDFFENTLTKKQKFENFLTYRKRLSRLSLSQALYFYENFQKFNEETLNPEEEWNEVYRVIIFFYKKMFFIEKYGDNKKNKKLDEKFLRNGIKSYLSSREKVDGYIIRNIKKTWRISRLNAVIRSSLRAAICEALFVKNPNFKIILSEYTGLISASVVDEKEVAFFNAVLDNIIKEIKTEKI